MAGWSRNNGDATPSRLTIEVGQSGGVCRLCLRGELDLQSCESFELALGAALASDADRVLVDLDGLAFIDSSGLQTLLRAKRHTEAGDRLRMTRGQGEVAQLFRLTALDLVLPFE